MTGAPPVPAGPPRTFPPGPSKRTFLPQTRARRIESLFWTMTWTLLARWTPPFLSGWRCLLLRCFGATVGRYVFIHASVRIRFPWNLTIGRDCVIHHEVIIDCMGPVTIGQGVRLSQYSHLCAGTHEYRDVHMEIQPGAITIGDQVWVAADAFVGPSATIGERTIVGARASVVDNLPANVIAVGEPARPFRQREPNNAGPPSGL